MLLAVEERGDMYFSVDVEADGPIPGEYSMLSFGLAVAGQFDGQDFMPADPAANTFYAELAPISDRCDPRALAVSGLDRPRLARVGRDPVEAMDAVAAWVSDLAGELRPVMVGFPLVFDWMFLYWYFVRFAREGSPFDFSAGLDMKTMFQQKSGRVLGCAGKDDLPEELRGSSGHAHHALSDAVEQAEIFVRLFSWQHG